MKKLKLVLPVEVIENKIYLIRGVKVMLDSDLAYLYGVLTKNLNLAVRRNLGRFPNDFMFQLSKVENENLRLQFETSSSRFQITTLNTERGGRRYLPYAFTEQGVAMLSAVLKSERAIQTSILIVRAFIKLREMLQSHKDILKEIEKIKKEQESQNNGISSIISIINKFFAKPEPKKEQIGFRIR